MFDALIIAICEQTANPGVCTSDINAAVIEAASAGLPNADITLRLEEARDMLLVINGTGSDPDTGFEEPAPPDGGYTYELTNTFTSDGYWGCSYIEDRETQSLEIDTEPTDDWLCIWIPSGGGGGGGGGGDGGYATPYYPPYSPPGGGGGGGTSSPQGPYSHTLCPAAQTANELSEDALMNEVTFDPNGNTETQEALQNPIEGAIAGLDGVVAAAVAQEVFNAPSGSCGNNACDAFRHVLWSAWMTFDVGPDAAKRYGDGRERTTNPINDQRAMDLYNNQQGRRIAQELSASGQILITPHELYEAIVDAINAGEIVTDLPEQTCGP